MDHRNPGSADPRPASAPEIDYSPRQYTRAETLRYGAKFLAVAAFFALLLWLAEKLSF